MATVLSNDTFESSIASGVSLVDFYADWCGPCQAIAPVLDELATQMEGKANIYKVDVDASGELAGQFGVMSIPTMLVFKDGELVDKTVGAGSKEELVALLEKHM